ncbi:MAG: hypothetical protein ACI9IV_002550 [Paracoccaceae bacterium]|jgi:hypothetical protein
MESGALPWLAIMIAVLLGMLVADARCDGFDMWNVTL